MGRATISEDISLDDLLRRQDEPPRKKRRLSEEPVELDESASDDSGSFSARNSGDEEDSQRSEDESSEEDGSDNQDSDAGSGDENQELTQESSLPTHDRLGISTSARINASKSQLSTSEQTARPSFAALGISKPLQTALKSMSIKVPTEVQAACIPPLLAGPDCIGNAKTGSGKTIAFAIPILQRLSVDPYGIFALVLTPTRELAFQISEQFSVLGAVLNIRTAVVVGGMDMMAQALELNNRPHVVIATPGRIVDHMQSSSGEWDLSRVKFLVLDEADRLLTPTFSQELGYLFERMPRERQTCLFTATLTPSIEELAAAPPRPGKQKPFIHRMKETVETVSTLKQNYILVPSHVRESYLFHILCHPPESTHHLRRAPPEPTKSSEEETIEQPPPTIIFCAKPKTAAYLTILLKTLGIRSTALHSRLTQRERLNSLQLFRASVIPVLVSTDVGARGLDIEDVAIVINWDLPSEPEEYTHRVGRTARAGRGGLAISFVTERDEERVLKIEDRIRTKLEEMDVPESKVLEKLNKVSTAKRLANMELHDSNFGKREEVHKAKNAKRVRMAEGED
ncbi:P-loop containing nucleoside triphosphate hydrolase protein [Panaeolus papilionaceus]|nr:P-loop containing nucleoside triphosphate hydrolase protein [Panaeolus papilionaceus]